MISNVINLIKITSRQFHKVVCLSAGVAAPKHYPRKLTLECFEACPKTLPRPVRNHSPSAPKHYPYLSKLIAMHCILMGAGCSSVDSMPAFEEVCRQIDPSQWIHLPFGQQNRGIPYFNKVVP